MISGEIRNDVLFGDDGWMFLWQGAQRQFDHLMGAKVPTSSIDAFTANLKARSSACAARGINFLHVVFPSKPVVMTEKLPKDIHARVGSLFEHQYFAALDTAGCTCYLYPRPHLRNHENVQTFRKVDTHMTATGNAIVAREILRRLGHTHNPLDHLEAFTQHRHGDLAQMAGIEQKPAELFFETRTRTLQIWDNRLSLPSNTDNIAISHNPLSASDKRLLALGDSFLRDCLLPLSTYYKDILYVRSAQFQPELLDMFAPDCVVTANAERYLSKVEPDAHAESVLMRGYGRNDYQPTQPFIEALKAQLAWKPYPARYESWSRKVNALVFDGLGVGQPNPDIRQIENEVAWMEAIGKDPQIIFHDTSMMDEFQYELEIALHCSVKCYAQVFIETIGNPRPFSEERSFRNIIHPGKNVIKIFMEREKRGRKIRFDPMNTQGRFYIESMALLRIC